MGKDKKVKSIHKQRATIPAPYIFKQEEMEDVEKSASDETNNLGNYQRVMSLSRMIRKKIEQGIHHNSFSLSR